MIRTVVHVDTRFTVEPSTMNGIHERLRAQKLMHILSFIIALSPRVEGSTSGGISLSRMNESPGGLGYIKPARLTYSTGADSQHSRILQGFVDTYNTMANGEVLLTRANIERITNKLNFTNQTLNYPDLFYYRDYKPRFLTPPAFTRTSLKGQPFRSENFLLFLKRYLINRFARLIYVNPYKLDSDQFPSAFMRQTVSRRSDLDGDGFPDDSSILNNDITKSSNRFVSPDFEDAKLEDTYGVNGTMSAVAGGGRMTIISGSGFDAKNLAELLRITTNPDGTAGISEVSTEDIIEYFVYNTSKSLTSPNKTFSNENDIYMFGQFYFSTFPIMAQRWGYPRNYPFLFVDTTVKKDTDYHELYRAHVPRKGDPLTSAKLEEACDRIFVSFLKSIGPHPEYGGTQTLVQHIVAKHGSLANFGLGNIDKYL